MTSSPTSIHVSCKCSCGGDFEAAPKPVEYQKVIIQETVCQDDSRRLSPSTSLEPRGGFRQAVVSKSLIKAIDREEASISSLTRTRNTLIGITRAHSFEEESGEINPMSREAYPLKAWTPMAIEVPTMLPSKLESGERVTVYYSL